MTTVTDDETMMISLRLPLDLVVQLDRQAREEDDSRPNRSRLVREMLTSPRHIPGPDS